MSDITFDIAQYPTLHAASLSQAVIRTIRGPQGCLPPETEVMTRRGWISIRDFDPREEALVYNPSTQTARFDAVEKVVLPDSGFWRLKNHHAVDMEVSDEHKVWYQTYYERKRKGRGASWVVRSGAEVGEHIASGKSLDAYIPATFDYESDSEYPLTDDEIRLSVAIAADGNVPKAGKRVYVGIRKERKKERLRMLLGACGIDWSESHRANRPTETYFSFVPPERTKDLTRFYAASRRQLEIIAEESLHWDGSVGEKGAMFTTARKAEADFMQFVYVSVGVPSNLVKVTYDNPEWNDTYCVTYGTERKNAWVNLKTCTAERTKSSDGKKYCLTTNTGMFVVRHNGKVFCTGNSAKTTWAFMELLRRACEQEPNEAGERHTKWLIGRTTYQQLTTATLTSARKTLGNIVEFRDSIPPRGRASFALEDGTVVKTEFLFLSLEGDAAIQKMLGEEFTGAFLDELSEFDESVVHAVLRRAGRYPSNALGSPTWTGIIGVTNGPTEGHWLDHWEKGRNAEILAQIQEELGTYLGGRPVFHAFAQPPGLLRPHTRDDKWVPNPMAENVNNLPGGYGYYYLMLADSDDAKIKAYVEGEFAPLKKGRLVFPEFSPLHIIDEDSFVLPHGTPLGLSFDFGRTPVCTIYAETTGGALVLVDEVMMEDASTERLITEALKPLLKKKYPHSRIAWATGDPTGEDFGSAVETSPYQVLFEAGIPMEKPSTNKIQPRLEAVKQRLTRLGVGGVPMLRVRSNCKYTIEALQRTYVYEQVSVVHDIVSEKPTKSHVNWVSDLADTVQYACLIRAFELEPARPKKDLKKLNHKWV